METDLCDSCKAGHHGEHLCIGDRCSDACHEGEVCRGKARDALAAFVHTIEATGGALGREDGTTVPACDEEWVDLGEAYLLACEALGWAPEVRNE